MEQQEQQDSQAPEHAALSPKEFGKEIRRGKTAVYLMLKMEGDAAPKHVRLNDRIFILESGREYLERLAKVKAEAPA